jgi:Na+-driven multidrug efflux pump
MVCLTVALTISNFKQQAGKFNSNKINESLSKTFVCFLCFSIFVCFAFFFASQFCRYENDNNEEFKKWFLNVLES